MSKAMEFHCGFDYSPISAETRAKMVRASKWNSIDGYPPSPAVIELLLRRGLFRRSPAERAECEAFVERWRNKDWGNFFPHSAAR